MLGTLQFDEWGYLPPGVHVASWVEIVERFGQGARRGWLLEGLRALLIDLRRAGVRDVWLDGSFVTEAPEPDDYDVCWSPAGANTDVLSPEFGYSEKADDSDMPNHELLRQRYRGDVFVQLPPWADFVATYTEDLEHRAKGIIKVDMESVP